MTGQPIDGEEFIPAISPDTESDHPLFNIRGTVNQFETSQLIPEVVRDVYYKPLPTDLAGLKDQLNKFDQASEQASIEYPTVVQQNASPTSLSMGLGPPKEMLFSRRQTPLQQALNIKREQLLNRIYVHENVLTRTSGQPLSETNRMNSAKAIKGVLGTERFNEIKELAYSAFPLTSDYDARQQEIIRLLKLEPQFGGVE